MNLRLEWISLNYRFPAIICDIGNFIIRDDVAINQYMLCAIFYKYAMLLGY